MPYVYKRYEWDLLPEEQEQARFISDGCADGATLRSRGIVSRDAIEEGAFMQFKRNFYGSVARRLGLSIYLEDGFGALNISEDCKKLIAAKIEREVI